ncbi:NUDIX domain-containing protein [Candidatus Gracilibacteria bacterium]|nr:NUDIX domain-containing protein [Candidatus Gracilibacteria bacterium]
MTQFFPPHLPYLGEKYYRRGKKIPKGFYRITVKAIVMNEDSEILLLKEGRWNDITSEFYREDGGMYDLPGGGLEWGEDFREGLFREIEEEMGIIRDMVNIGESPLYVQVTELDDRYHDDQLRDDFYPVCMMYFPVHLTSLDFHRSSECIGYEWTKIADFSKIPIWTHSMSLTQIFKPSDFPRDLISIDDI